MQVPAIPNINLIHVSAEAQSTICSYDFNTVRKGYSIREYVTYKQDWLFFNTVWSYNYTVSTMNGQGANLYQPWQFIDNNDRVNYNNGQIAHVAVYPNSAAVFNNIEF